jgi:hypothetical protein
MNENVARPWSNGTDWEIWEANNCDRCIKEPTCDLILAAFLNGGLTAEMAERMGWKDEYEITGRWFCAERETEPAPPKPAALEMAEAGAQQLPGFESGEGGR